MLRTVETFSDCILVILISAILIASISIMIEDEKRRKRK